MNVGVIGLGKMGKLHVRVYTEIPGVTVIAAQDTDQATRDDVNKQFGVPVFSDLAEMLQQPLDAVSVCVPTFLHKDVALQVMEAGIPLLIEKPYAATADEGRTLLAKAKEMNLPVMVGHIERFNPAIMKLKELAQEDDIISINIERVGPYPPRIQDVGVVRDLGPHDLDLVRFITGREFDEVHAVTSTTIGEHEDTAFITARMDNGVLAHINTNWTTPNRSRRIRVTTRQRCIDANLISQEVKTFSTCAGDEGDYCVKDWFVKYQEPARSELTAFVEGVKNGTPLPITDKDGHAVLEIFERLGDVIS